MLANSQSETLHKRIPIGYAINFTLVKTDICIDGF